MPITDFKQTFSQNPLKKIHLNNPNHVFLAILIAALILGVTSGFFLSRSNNNKIAENIPLTEKAKTPQQDTQTFRDFAQGTIQKRPAPKNTNEYVEGTHLLVREGAVPVALTSSVVDLSQYEGKKVKIFGETQKAIKEGWLMDVGKVEVEN